jgi:hypothetical protein
MCGVIAIIKALVLAVARCGAYSEMSILEYKRVNPVNIEGSNAQVQE